MRGDKGQARPAVRLLPTEREAVADRPTVLAAGGAVVALGPGGAGPGGAPPPAGPIALASVGRLGDVSDSDRYLPRGRLGRGGMGEVELAIDRVLGRPVARKQAAERPLDALLLSEAQVCSQLEHPSIVPVYDAGCDAEGRPFYTMRVVDGRPLGELIARAHDGCGAVSQGRLLGILRQVCLAIDYAHSRGVVHRDLKPDNVVVGAFGEVYVLDWGVACVAAQSDVRLTVRPPGAEAVAGTPGYMSPEQALGKPIGPAADVFALGVMLHEILIGELPYDDADLGSVVRRAEQPGLSPPPSLAGELPRLGPPFAALVGACLRRRPQGRPPSARVLAEAIERHLDQERERAERRRQAAERVAEGRQALAEARQLGEQAAVLAAEAAAGLAQLEPWRGVEAKRPAWELGERALRLQAQAAGRLADAEAALSRALGRVPDHPEARAELAALHHREMRAAEAAEQPERAARELGLARSYDDGPLARELSDAGELLVHLEPAGALLALERYQAMGPLLEPVAVEGELAAGRPRRLPAGSYRLTARLGARCLRYPLRIERGKRCRLRLRLPTAAALPAGMIAVPAGPYLAREVAGDPPVERRLGDFALAELPVTLGAYAAWLDALTEPEVTRRTPMAGDGSGVLVRDASGRFCLSATCVEGPSRKYVPADAAMQLPCHGLRWYDALAYTRWLAEQTSLPYRLPAASEWEKAMRGADGRLFPMGNALDPAFAKLRQSRPEATQPEPVGAFSLDVSPYGVRDLAGGVCDWTATFLDGRPPPEIEQQGGAESDERRAIYLGGHWGGTTAVRPGHEMSIKHRSQAVGFRLAMDLALDRPSAELEVEPLDR